MLFGGVLGDREAGLGLWSVVGGMDTTIVIARDFVWILIYLPILRNGGLRNMGLFNLLWLVLVAHW